MPTAKNRTVSAFEVIYRQYDDDTSSYESFKLTCLAMGRRGLIRWLGRNRWARTLGYSGKLGINIDSVVEVSSKSYSVFSPVFNHLKELIKYGNASHESGVGIVSVVSLDDTEYRLSMQIASSYIDGGLPGLSMWVPWLSDLPSQQNNQPQQSEVSTPVRTLRRLS